MSSNFTRMAKRSRRPKLDNHFRIGVEGLETRWLPSSVYNETFDPDLSNTQSAPTQLAPLKVGTNSVFATIGSPGGLGAGDPQDWFTIHVPTGMALSAINLSNYYG